MIMMKIIYKHLVYDGSCVKNFTNIISVDIHNTSGKDVVDYFNGPKSPLPIIRYFLMESSSSSAKGVESTPRSLNLGSSLEVPLVIRMRQESCCANSEPVSQETLWVSA